MVMFIHWNIFLSIYIFDEASTQIFHIFKIAWVMKALIFFLTNLSQIIWFRLILVFNIFWSLNKASFLFFFVTIIFVISWNHRPGCKTHFNCSVVACNHSFIHLFIVVLAGSEWSFAGCTWLELPWLWYSYNAQWDRYFYLQWLYIGGCVMIEITHFVLVEGILKSSGADITFVIQQFCFTE